jgi:hypothetical protein
MSKTRYWSRVLMAALAGFLVASTLAACASLSARSATPTDTPFVLLPTATPPQVTEQVPIPPTTQLYPSPDGTLLVGVYGSVTTHRVIKLYNLAGELQGQPYVLPTGFDADMGWLGDSSAFWFSASDTTTGSVHTLALMDRQGRVYSTGVDMTYPLLSQDGHWLGGISILPTQSVEIAPRSGGPAQVLAQGGVFLGWQNNRAVYATGTQVRDVYMLDPTGGTPQFLTQVTTDFENPPFVTQDDSSPDGQALVLYLSRSITRVLVGNELLMLPRNAAALPLLWTGPHDIVAQVQQDLVIVDIITGKVLSDTGASNMAPMAVSGRWMIANSGYVGQPWELNLVNIVTHASYDIGPDPGDGPVLPLGNQGRFLVNPPSSSAYVIDTAHLT